MKAILDTSVLIATERGQIRELPGDCAISVLTLAELHAGAVAARSPRTRAVRFARVAAIEQLFQALPVDRRVALKFGELAASTRRLASRPHVIDALIAATAIVHGVAVWTRDDDFDRIPGVDVVKI